jgi:hypothetical protein
MRMEVNVVECVMWWINLAENSDKWRDLVNAVKETFRLHKIPGIFWLSE